MDLKSIVSAEPDSHTGACDCDDDVHCPAVYSDSHRGNGQDHEGTDGAWCRFEDGNLIQKAKSMVPLLIPLFVSAFRRADDLAMAMEARCYSGGEGRTKMKPLRYQGTDRKAYVILIAFLVLVIVARVLLHWPQ